MAEGMTEAKEQSILDELAHSETVRKLIECPVCLELPLPPIYVCNKGHIVCNSCQARTYACPLCREHYSTTRGFVAEGIIEKCILRCKHAEQGCPLSMRGSELVEHLEICDYRPVKCVDCAGKLINFDEYEDHLLKLHRINGINQNRAYVIYSMNLAHQIAFGTTSYHQPQYIHALVYVFNGHGVAFDNVTFLLRLYATHWFVCAWISLLGPKSDCAKYEALLEFHPTNDDSVVHTWQGPVNHFRADPAKEIFLQGRGLITPMETLMQMAPVANDHAEWLYNIEILPANTEKSDTEDSVPSEEQNLEENLTEAVNVGANKKSEKRHPSNEISLGTTTGGDTTDNAAASSTTIPLTQRAVCGPDSTCISNTKQARVPKSPARIVSEAPQQRPPTGTSFRTPRRGGSLSTVLTPGPATLSPSTSVLAVSATVVPTSGSLSDVMQTNTSTSTTNSTSSPFCMQSFPSDSNQSPMTVSTAQPSSRLLNSLRRASPFSFLLRSTENRNYSIADDDWDYSTDTEEEQ